jgi:hypothetical protein
MEETIAEAMAAFIEIEGGFGGKIGWGPDDVSFFNVEVATIHIGRNVVIAIAGDPAQFSVLIKAITAGGIGDQREELIVS